MKKKVLSLCLVLVLVAIAITGATLAYFTDADEAVNIFSVGSVEIELIESNFHPVVDDKTEEEIKEDAKTYDTSVENILPGEWVRKAPYVINNGKNDAYVRIRMVVDKFFNEHMVHTETTTAQEDGSIITTINWYDEDGNFVDSSNTYKDVEDYATIEYIYTYTEALAPGEMTYWPPFWRYKIADELTQDVFADYIENSTEIVIAVYANAIQAETFENAIEAFAAFDQQA